MPVIVAAIASVFVSCKDDNAEPAPGPVGKHPSVTLEAGDVTFNTLSFTVNPRNADQCAYIYAVKGAEKPDAAAVLSEGTSVPADRTSVVPLSGLQPETAYVVWAVASSGDAVGDIAELEMTTGAENPADAVLLDRVIAARYYGRSNESSETGNYYMILGNVEAEIGDDNTEQPAADGCLLYINLWCALPSGQLGPESGMYIYSGSQSRMTFDPFYTLSVVRRGDEITKTEFSDGTITVSREGEQYVVTARMAAEDGTAYNYKFSGSIVFDDLTRFGYDPVDSDINTSFIGTKAICHGDKHGKGSTSIDLLLYDTPLDDEGYLGGPGHAVVVEFNTSLTRDEDAVIPSGTYRVSGGYAAGTATPGSAEVMNGVSILMGTYVEKDTERSAMYGFASEGTVTVTLSGETYTVDVNLTVDGGHKVKGKYRGAIAIDDLRGGGGGYSTLRKDTYPDLSGIEKGVLCYRGDMWRVGLSNFIMDISSDDVSESMLIEVFCDRNFTTDIPAGTYEMMPERTEECFVPYSIMQGYPNESHFFGTWYRDWDAEKGDYRNYAPAVSGNMEVSKEGDIYTVEYRFKDDCTEPNKIEGTWSGTLDFVSSPLSLAPVSAGALPVGLGNGGSLPESAFRSHPIMEKPAKKTAY